MVRYDLGAHGENSRPVFKNDYERQIVYPTQKKLRDQLQSAMEGFIYGSHKALLSRAEIANSMGEMTVVRVLVSSELFSKIINMYQFAW